MNYVIIGNSAAAIGTVEGIRQRDKKNPIRIISAEPHHTYSRPLISYLLAGKVKEEKMCYRPVDFYEKNNVEVIYAKATGVDIEKKQVLTEEGKSIAFDKLMVATGGKPFIPPMEGMENKKGIFNFHKLDDIHNIKKVLTGNSKAVIIGAGLIGTKAAEALSLLGIDVTIIELADKLLSSILDEKSAEIVKGVMEENNIKFRFQTTVSKVLGDDKVTGVQLSTGEQLDCDVLIVAIGVVPNSDLVKGTDIALNRGILIDNKMQTNIPGIYAAGDVSEGYDMLIDAKRVIPILPNAYKQGETAGLNMAGDDIEFTGAFPMNSIGFFGFPMITAGIYKGEGFAETISLDEENRSYKKLVYKGKKLVGFIILQDIDRAGMLTSILKKGIDITPLQENMIKSDFGYRHWPKELRKERMFARGGM